MFYNLERVPGKQCYVEARAEHPIMIVLVKSQREIVKQERDKIHVVQPIRGCSRTKVSDSVTIQKRRDSQELGGDMPLSSSQLNNNKKQTARILETEVTRPSHIFYK